MGAAGIVATLAGRPTDRAYVTLLAAVVTLLINPRFAADPGWQLSFAALVGIMVWAHPLREVLLAPLARRMPRRLAAPLAEGIALTLAATVATAPLIAHDFERVSIAALPANLAVLPVIAPVMWLGMLIGLLAQLPAISIAGVDPIAVLGAVEGRLIGFVAAIARAFSRPGWAQVDMPLPATAAVLAVYACLAAAMSVAIGSARRRLGTAPPRVLAFAVSCLILLALAPALLGRPASASRPGDGVLRITALDVGQGDSILIQPPRGAPILVDGGPPGAAAADALARLGIERLRAVFVTHDELDHAGGLPAVLERVPAAELVHARPAPEAEAVARGTGARVVRTAEGGSFDFGRLELDVLWPPRDHLEAAGREPQLRRDRPRRPLPRLQRPIPAWFNQCSNGQVWPDGGFCNPYTYDMGGTGYKALDLQVTKDIGLGDLGSMYVRLDVLNVFNSDNLVDYVAGQFDANNQQLTARYNPNGNITGFPRTLRASFGVKF